MKRKLPLRLLILAIFTLPILPFSPGCSGGGGGTPPPAATGLLYALDIVNLAVYVINNINTQNGAVDPVATISGDLTLLQSPTALAVDGLADILYVADTTQQAVLAFVPASQKNGNVPPLRVFPGIQRASAMFYDEIDDTLFVADDFALAIFAWDNIRQLEDGTPPSRTIPLDFVPSSVAVDTQRDVLYVGDPSTQAVNEYLNANTLGVKPTPNNIIQDSTQQFVNINSLTLNVPNNFLFVAESANPSIEVFETASTLDGLVPPIRSLEGANTSFTIHLGQAIFVENVLYVITSDISNNVAIFQNANGATGDLAPDRSLQINGAAELVGLAVDLAH